MRVVSKGVCVSICSVLSRGFPDLLRVIPGVLCTGGVYNCQVHVPSPSPRLMGPYGAQSGLYITQASIRTPARAPRPLV